MLYLLKVLGCSSGIGSISVTDLSIEGYTITPEFNSLTTEYIVTVPEAVDNISMTITSSDPDVSIVVNGTDIGYGTTDLVIPLDVGTNTISIDITADTGAEPVAYTVTVLRSSSNSLLSDLYVTAITGTAELLPEFTPEGTIYVVLGTGLFTITPTAADETGVIRVQGIIVPSGEATDAYGYGPQGEGYDYTIEVTAQDGITTTTYSINAQLPAT